MTMDEMELIMSERKSAPPKVQMQKPCLFTMIVYVKDLSRLPYLLEKMEVIGSKFPCRIIFIQVLKDASSDFLNIEPYSQTLAGMPFKEEFCEIFNIQCSASFKDRVHLLVLPYLVPDLPIYLWWADDFNPQNESLIHLQSLASRIIVDLGFSQDWLSTCHGVYKIMQKGQKEIVDLNWAKMRGWRINIAKVFDTQGHLTNLEQSKLIQITYNRLSQDLEGSEIQAIYLQGWIAAQLGWQFKRFYKQDSTLNVDYTFKEKEIHVIISPHVDDKAPQGAILNVEIATYDDTFYSLTRIPGQSQIMVHITTIDQCDMPLNIPLKDCNLSSSLIREMIYAPVSKQYTNLLKLFSHY